MFKKSKKKENLNIQYKTFFLIANVILSFIAISFLIGQIDAGPVAPSVQAIGASGGCANGQCGLSGGAAPSNPYNPTIPNANGGGVGLATQGGLYQQLQGKEGTINQNNLGDQANPSSTPSSGGPISNPINNPAGEGAAGQTPEQQWGTGQNIFQGQGGSGGTTVQPAAGGGNSGTPQPGTGGLPTYPPVGQQTGGGTGVMGGMSNYFNDLPTNLGQLMLGAGIGMMIGQFAGGKNGAMWGAVAGAAGMITFQLVKMMLKSSPNAGLYAGIAGIAVAAIIFILTYKKESTKVVTFSCLPWRAPIGGADCEKCNQYSECSEYMCKSLGQACNIVNKGTAQQKCIWMNPYDTNSPTIEMTNVTKGHQFYPDKSIRPPATGVEIKLNGGKCIKPFTPLKFEIATNEPSSCKIDYNLTTNYKTGFDDMAYFMNGDPTFSYNHTEQLSLPGPGAVNAVNPEIKNDGSYILYIRCQDANGNVNQDPFSVKFCVDPSPDTTAPMIVNVSIPSGSPIQFNRSDLDLEVYLNEPSDCKWSRDILKYDQMPGTMTCDNNLWEMNNLDTYTCRVKLTGLESNKENVFYFRCKDQPWADEGDRNTNTAPYVYRVEGTKPLNIMEIGPNNTIAGGTDIINATLFVRTDNGYNNGEALCYYSLTGDENSYIEFSNTGTNIHTQRQDLPTGNYVYYIKCVDLGGNAAYNLTSFTVETDKVSPIVVRAYKESGELKIMTHENAECSYSFDSCNFEIDSGIKMSSVDYTSHSTDWKLNKIYYIRCKDRYDNEPNPNTCSIIIKPSMINTNGKTQAGTIEI